MHTYAYLELFKFVFSLNKEIFQLFDKISWMHSLNKDGMSNNDICHVWY